MPIADQVGVTDTPSELAGMSATSKLFSASLDPVHHIATVDALRLAGGAQQAATQTGLGEGRCDEAPLRGNGLEQCPGEVSLQSPFLKDDPRGKQVHVQADGQARVDLCKACLDGAAFKRRTTATAELPRDHNAEVAGLPQDVERMLHKVVGRPPQFVQPVPHLRL
jgi:hypothetical protein